MNIGKENEILEFKKTTGELKEGVISISAILNKRGGGELYFGVYNNGDVHGQQIGDSTLRDVSQAITDNLEPKIYPKVELVYLDDMPCIYVAFNGDNPPYFAYGRAYMRVADEDKQMSAAQLEQFFISKHEQVSNWDSTESKISISDIDVIELEKYINKANAAGRLDYPYTEPADVLVRLKLLDNNKLNNTADVMFSKKPSTEIQMAIFATEERLTFIDINRIEGRIIDLVNAGERYIRSNMRYRAVIDGTQLERKEIPEIPHVAIREALLNSFCHKNFRTPQNNEVAIFSNRIEIYNPGTFPAGKTPEDFISGSSRSVHRNPLLAQIMYYPKEIESFGTGLKRIADTCNDAGVKYEFVSDNYGFTVVFYRPEISGTESYTGENNTKNITDADKVQSANSKCKNCTLNCTLSQKAIIDHLIDDPAATQEMVATAIGKSLRSVKTDMAILQENGIIKRDGSRRDGQWIVNIKQ